MESPSEAPWYRQGWPWFLLLLPASVVVASFVTLWIAASNPQSLVRGDYYRDGLALNRNLANAEAARERGLAAELTVDGSNQTLVLSMKSDTTLPQTLQLDLLHPTDAAMDRTVILTRRADGLYVGRLEAIPVGRRYLQLGEADDPSGWVLRGELASSLSGSTRLLPAAD
jgi:hypothetical protein